MSNKTNVYIIGASGFGREVESWISSSDNFLANYSLKGFLDDNINALEGYPSDYNVISKIDDFRFKDDECVLLCITEPEIKEKIVRRINGRARFLSFIHESSLIGKSVNIGEGTIIGPNCVLTTNVKIGPFVTIVLGTTVGHDSVISDFASLMVQVTISGKVEIGKYVFIGNNSNVYPGKKVGEKTKISAGSSVFKDIPQNSLVWGNPSRCISRFYKNNQ